MFVLHSSCVCRFEPSSYLNLTLPLLLIINDSCIKAISGKAKTEPFRGAQQWIAIKPSRVVGLGYRRMRKTECKYLCELCPQYSIPGRAV